MTTTNQSIVCADCATAGHAASECPDRSASHLGADRMSAAADMLETALPLIVEAVATMLEVEEDRDPGPQATRARRR